MGLKENLKAVKKRISTAAQKNDKDENSVKLVAVSKGRSIGQIKELQALGQKDFGENRLKELLKKEPKINGVLWHFVGNLQSNKVREVVRLCAFIHSVDSLKLIRKIDSAARNIGKVQNIFLEANISGEESKHGFNPKELASVLDTLKQLPFQNIRVLGLMAMAPLINPEKTRTIFRTLFELASIHQLKELSMGMSNDFEVAVEEGATFVRIGTAVFGV